jgi:hypothetical protein
MQVPLLIAQARKSGKGFSGSSTPVGILGHSIRASFMEANTEAVSAVWDQGWRIPSTAHGNGARSVALYAARHYSDRALGELAQLIGGMEYPAVTMAIRRLERRLKFDKDLAKKTQRVLNLLQVKGK